jgi:hypothetical protein
VGPRKKNRTIGFNSKVAVPFFQPLRFLAGSTVPVTVPGLAFMDKIAEFEEKSFNTSITVPAFS